MEENKTIQRRITPRRNNIIWVANDDAIRAVKLITGVMANAIVEANGGKIVDYVSGKGDENGTDIMKRAVESVKRKEDRKPMNNNRPFDKKQLQEKINGTIWSACLRAGQSFSLDRISLEQMLE